jgi:hypothetical protein
MSIKYLQDQQLNQVQQSPNNSPWAKLIAQSEMLERNKMRQPQGQAPQGTVAGNIQQQLRAAQEQEGERQNADLYKSQMLAQLIGSGQIPANFASQGYADGGLAQPQAGTGAYRGIVMPGQQAALTSSRIALQPNSLDPNAQEKKHGMLQSLLDNSIVGMVQGKANIGNAMQDYADLFSGKVFSRGFAEGGDIRGFAAGGETMAEQLARIRPQIEATLKNQGWTKEAIDRYVSAYKPEMGRGFTNQFPATTAQPPSLDDMLNLQRRKMAQTGLDIKDPNTIHIPPTPDTTAPAMRAPAPELPVTEPHPYQQAAEARAAKLRAIQEQAAGAQRTLPAPGPTSTSSLESVLGKNANVQDFINSLKSKQLSTTGAPTSATPEGVENLPAVRTGTGLPAETNYGRGATVDAPYFIHPNATPNADAAAKSAWESANILDRANNKWDRGQSPEAKAWLASQQQANAPVEGKPPVPYDPMSPGATTLEEVAAKAKQGLGSLGEAAKVVGRPIAKVAGALSPIGDLMMAGQFTGNNTPLLAKALGIEVPSMLPQGEVSPVLGQLANDITDAKNYVGDKATSVYDQFKNRLNSGDNAQPDAGTGGATTPQTPPTTPPQTATAQTPSASPTQGTIYKDNGVTRTKNSVTVTPDKHIDLDAMSNAHKQPDVQPSQVSEAAQKVAASQQAISAIERRPNEEGQGSILDSLYSKLKDSDVDYSDLAKRISQNEYDLARERKDGTFNAILGGVGAALTQAGTYQGVGDRVFKPGLGTIAGAGIMGGLKMSAASDEAISKKSQDNMTAMIALKKLKRESMNDVLDALSAQKQVDATLRSQGITAQHYADVARHQSTTEEQEDKKIAILGETAAINAAHTNAEIAELASRNPDQKAAIELAQTKANNAERNLASIRSGAHMPDDPNVMAAQKEYNDAMSTLNYLLQSLKVPVAPAGSASPVRGPNDIKVLSRERI